MAPQRCQCQIPGPEKVTTVHGIKDFEDVTKLRILR